MTITVFFHRIFFLFLLLPIISAHAEKPNVSGDSSYFIYEDQGARYIYPAEYRNLVPALAGRSLLFKEFYEKEFNWSLDQKPTYILNSSQNQIANGYATVAPRVYSSFYNGSVQLVDEMAAESWLFELLSHETAHLYQLDVKQGYSKKLKQWFGMSEQTGTLIFPPFIYMQHPNLFLPTVFLEGNATYNEGRFGNGGRLYNGAARNLLLQMVQSNRIDASRLFNEHLDFPFGMEKYLVGGFFFLNLSESQAKKNANIFFYEHSDFKANPFNINDPFRFSFNRGYPEAFESFKTAWAPLANTQSKAQEKPLFKSLSNGGFSRDEFEIRFLTTNYKSLPVAHIYNLQNKTWSEKSVNVPMGKLFKWHDGRLATASSEYVNANHKSFGLFADGYKLIKGTENKFYNDFNNVHDLWADSKTSFDRPQIFDGQKFVAEVNSSAIIGSDNKFYYFKQSQKTRTLYQNDNALFSFQGYYGYPIEATTDSVYFIGPSERGTSLYLWRDKKFSRIVISDQIVDAVRVDEDTFLIAELSIENGYEYKFVPAFAENLEPFEYKYDFEKDTSFSLFQKELPPLTPKQVTLSEKSYSSFRDFHLTGIDPVVFLGVNTPVASAVLHFSDPLNDHEIRTFLNSGSFGEFSIGAQYINLKNIVNWDLLSQFKKTAKVVDGTTQGSYLVKDRYDSWLAAMGFEFPFYVQPRSMASWSSHFIYQDEQPHIFINDLDKDFSFLNQLSYKYAIHPQLSYRNYKDFAVELSNQFFRTVPDWSVPRNVFGARISASHDVYRETFIKLSGQAAYTDGLLPGLQLRSTPDDSPYSAAHQILRYSQFTAPDFFELRKTSAELTQAFNYSYYFSKFPFSLRRFALLANYSDYRGATQHHQSPIALFREAGVGLDLDILFAHKFPFHMQILRFKTSYDDSSDTLVILGMNQQF